MTSNKPYLIRALYEWLADNHATPYIMVDSMHPDLRIPPGIDQDGKVVLNIAERAVQGLVIENTHSAFSARFGGRAFEVYVPIPAVMAIYSMEDGEGMMFADNSTASASENDATEPQAEGLHKSKPTLTIVE